MKIRGLMPEGTRLNVEIDLLRSPTAETSARGPGHEARIQANDPSSITIRIEVEPPQLEVEPP
ncbi:MAG: hypothetical protein AMXMBFR34_50140 [Myxococcaceae bacterium]